MKNPSKAWDINMIGTTAANANNLQFNAGTDVLVLTTAGNVGIGTTSPAVKFHVGGVGADTASARFVGGTSNVVNVDVGFRSAQGYIGTQSNHSFEIMTNNTEGRFVIAAGGTIDAYLDDEVSNVAMCYSGAELSADAARTIGDCTAGGADYAELYPVEAGIDYGEIVSLGTNLVDTYATAKDGKVSTTTIEGRIAELERSSKSYQSNVLGITSFNYSDFTSAGRNLPEGVNSLPVALSGRVPVKVSLEGGAIKIGDRITSSSVAGVGMKATTSGMTVGIALEPFSDAATTTGKILVFVNLGYSKLDSEIAKGESGGWIVDQASGRVKSSYGLEVPAIFASSGKWSIDENGKLIAREIETQKLTVTGPPGLPGQAGITIYDRATGGPVCVFSENGVLKSETGACGSTTLTTSGGTQATASASTSTPDTIAPTITILGNNPAVIAVGSTYADPGVTITDNVSQNLGYTASLNGGPALSQGAGLSLDTSTTTTHAILYTATDSAGNSATASRTVEVVSSTATTTPP
ncbi:MAG: DUF5011 domain-containing protein [bacterium]|nr:DUF5011 domain-containing protein [bacterium]